MQNNYGYRARDHSGKLFTGQLSAGDKKAAAAQLREQGFFIVDIYPVSGHGFGFNFQGKKPGPGDLAAYCRQVSTMLGAGVPILNCLSVMESQAGNKILARASAEISQKLQEGRSLYQAVKQLPDVFPGIFASLVKAGEESGALEKTLIYMSEHYERESEIMEKTKSAMVYPAVVLSVALLVIIFLLLFILPPMAEMLLLQNVDLPIITHLILMVSNFLSEYWIAVLIFLLAAGAGIGRYLKTGKGKRYLNHVVINTPLLSGLIKKIIISRFSRTFSILLQSGIPVLRALDIVKETLGNHLVAEAVEEAKDNIKSGRGIAYSFSKNVMFPPMMVQMVKVGEGTGKLDKVFEQIAVFYEQELDNILPRLLKLIEPLLVLFVGAIVGLIVASVFLPLIESAGTL